MENKYTSLINSKRVCVEIEGDIPLLTYLKGVLHESGFRVLQEASNEAVFKGCEDRILIYLRLHYTQGRGPLVMVIRDDDYCITNSIFLLDKKVEIGGKLLDTIRKVWEKE